MQLKRKAIVDEVWENHSGAGAEPMPDWLKAVAEPDAKPGTTFLIGSSVYQNRLVPANYYVIKGPTDIYPCSPEGLAASYELPEVPEHVPGDPEKPDVSAKPVPPPEQIFKSPFESPNTVKG